MRTSTTKHSSKHSPILSRSKKSMFNSKFLKFKKLYQRPLFAKSKQYLPFGAALAAVSTFSGIYLLYRFKR